MPRYGLGILSVGTIGYMGHSYAKPARPYILQFLQSSVIDLLTVSVNF